MDLHHYSDKRREKVIIAFRKMHLNARMPDYGSAEAAGADLYALDTVTIAARGRARMSTGVAVQIPLGYEGQVRPRSGLAAKQGVTVLNAPGTIDSDYRGEIQVLLVSHNDEPVQIKAGDRIAQLVIAPVFQALFMDAEDLTATGRGAGGFGSTGR